MLFLPLPSLTPPSSDRIKTPLIMNDNTWSSSWLVDHVGRCLEHLAIEGVDYFNCCQWRQGANDAILKVEENTNWRLRLLIICSIESESQILGWANRNANGKGTRRNEEKRNTQIEYYVCLLVRHCDPPVSTHTKTAQSLPVVLMTLLFKRYCCNNDSSCDSRDLATIHYA
jgi:hypothetical protein